MKNSKKSKLVSGVGVNDSECSVERKAMIGGKRKRVWRCPIYLVWSNMLMRCYSTKYQARQPTYVGCAVAPEWLTFSAFRDWMLVQDHEDKQIDKDLLLPGNKIYGPDNCVLVSSQLNTFMTDRGAARGEWPIGVHLHKDSGRFQAQCRNPFTGRQGHLGLFTSPVAAHEAWRQRKHEHACTYADMQEDPRIAAALRSRYAKVDESALRKRHQPGEYSFDGLKQILAMPVSRGDFA